MKEIKFSGYLKSYLRWPLFLSLLLVAVNGALFAVDVRAGLWMLGATGLYLIAAGLLYYRRRPLLVNELITFAAEYGQVQKELLLELSIPYAMLDGDGKILWANRAFEAVTGRSGQTRRQISAVFPKLGAEEFPANGEEKELEFVYEERDYRARLRCIRIDELIEKTNLLEADQTACEIYALYLFDETELNKYIRMYQDETMVMALMYLDNYDEALNSVEEVRRSLLTALIDRKINKYFTDLDAFVKKYEKDKYILVMRRRTLNELREKRFDILEEVKTINIGNEMAVTMSIGVGANAGSFAKNAEHARVAIDLALGRGGDQVVMKDGERIQYFGGKTQAVEKSTRVKARVKAHALKEFMGSKEKVVVMGHRLPDVDSFGAAVGIYRAARTMNKRTYIVLDQPTSSVRPLMDGFLMNQDYAEDMFINCHEAREIVDDNTLLAVVDVNRPSYTECEELLYMTKTIVVLDHHRQGSDVIRNSVLSYIEPYASSACEMVAEILQYFSDGIRIRNIEADSLYAGIMVDTDNFLQKTGVRTFEAAAFLRRCGADVTRVRKLFREDMRDYQARGETIRNAELFRGAFAISVCPSDAIESPTVVGAQAANELLNIVGVKASFVLTWYNDQIYVSARAIDEVNVQIIMERMGGGGHLNIAGCQLKDMSMDEGIAYLKEVLSKMLEEGEI